MSRDKPGPLTPRLSERFREIRGRPSRRVWVGLGFIAAALAVLLVTSPLVGFITENEWYNALGIGSVYRTRIGYEAWLFFVTFGISFGFAAANVMIALRQRSGGSLLAVGISRRIVRTQVGAAGLATGALIALVVAAGARTRWTDLALFLHHTSGTSTGVTEPLYGLDVSFFLLTLPFLHDLVGWCFGLLFAVGLLTAVLYAWSGQMIDLRFSRAFRFGGNRRIVPQFDIFNVGNAATIVALNGAVGPTYRVPSQIVAPRIMQIGLSINF